MKTTSYSTRSIKKSEINKEWFIIDAEDKVLGRMVTKIATMLRGKHKASYTPHMDDGDCIIVINAEKIKLTGNKWEQKKYITYSGYPGGQKVLTANQVMAKHPTKIVENAVKGMLPKNKLGAEQFRNLFVYAGSEHPHSAQKPQNLEI